MTQELETKHDQELLPALVNGALGPDRTDQVRSHVASCSDCALEMREWESVGASVQLAAARAPAPSRGVIDRVWLKIEEGRPVEASHGLHAWRERIGAALARRQGRRFSPLGAGAIVAGIAAVTLIVFGGAYAREIFTAFQPKQLVAVPVTMDQLNSLPALDEYGTYTRPDAMQPLQAVSAEQIAALSTMRVLMPAVLPSGIPPSPSYQIMPGQSASFTFSADKARASAAAKGKSLPPMPPDVDGTTLQLTTGAVVVTAYGGTLTRPGGPVATEAPGITAVPKLIVAQAQAPVATSNGASADVIERYLLIQPGISPELANAIRAIGDPSTTLPVPIPIAKAASHDVQVQGVKGLAVADSTGIGGGILWQKNDTILLVAGMLAEKDLLSVANSLR